MPEERTSGVGAISRLGAIGCFVLAAYLFSQVLSLLFIHQIAERARSNDGVVIPVSVRLVGFAADRLQRDVIKAPLRSGGSQWPLGFRMFFVLELCGLVGLSLGFTQLGAGILWQRGDWNHQARKILHYSGIALLAGIMFLMAIRL